jgi:hypothetical protein
MTTAALSALVLIDQIFNLPSLMQEISSSLSGEEVTHQNGKVVYPQI